MYNIKQSFELYCERAVIMICGSKSRCDEDGLQPGLIVTKHNAFYNDYQTVKFA